MIVIPAGCAGGIPVRRPERPGDVALLFDLFRAAHGAVLAGLDLAIAETLLRQQSAGQAATYRARHPDARFDVVEVAGATVGRIVDVREPGGLRLVDIALLPDWRGRGIGSALVRSLQDEARAAGVGLRLSALASNAGALRFYGRLGFVAESTPGTHVALRWTPSNPAAAPAAGAPV